MDLQESLEGFICPICMTDLFTLSLLIKHFESAHEEDKALVDQFKGLFEKAKDKLNLNNLKRESTPSNQSNNENTNIDCTDNSDKDINIWRKQKLGKRSNHTDSFISHRKSKIDVVIIEKNKIMIRLQKIADIDVKAYDKRKELEQSLVPWAPDFACTICMHCGISFQKLMLKLRHHCRLCGCAICNHCSNFLPLNNAHRINAKEAADDDADVNHFVILNDEYGIRMCPMCKCIVESQTKQSTISNECETIRIVYEKLSENMKKSMIAFEKFQESNKQLVYGNSSIKETAEFKDQVILLDERIDTLSNRIYNLKTPPSSEKLKRMVVVMATDFIKNHVNELKEMATEKQLKDKMREIRNDIEDPFSEQIDIVKGYIRNAQQNGKIDELNILKENLRDLENAKRNQNN